MSVTPGRIPRWDSPGKRIGVGGGGWEMKTHNGDGSQTPEPTHRYQWEGWAEGEGRGSPLCQAAVMGTFCAWLKNLPTLQGWSQDPY